MHKQNNKKRFIEYFEHKGGIKLRVIVLMSTYNGEGYIDGQIRSILSQKGNFALDLLVRDDGSMDSTKDILKRYEDEKKLNWYTGENLGPAKSFMDLLENCGDYDYYAFADQDDVWLNNKIQRGIEQLKSQKSPALYCSNARLVNAKLESLGRNVYRRTPKTDFETVVCAGGLLGCTMIFNYALFEEVRKAQKELQIIMHDYFVAILCAALNGKIIYDEVPSMLYRQHQNNVVGCSYGFVNTIRNRVKDIISAEPILISSQAESILLNYQGQLPTDKKIWLQKVAHYRDCLLNRIQLACTLKTHYINTNMGVKLRLSILLGNR